MTERQNISLLIDFLLVKTCYFLLTLNFMLKVQIMETSLVISDWKRQRAEFFSRFIGVNRWPKNITIMLVVSCRCQLVCFANCNVHFQASENTIRKYLTDGSSRSAAGIFERIFMAQQGKPNFFIRQLHNCPLCNLDTNV